MDYQPPERKEDEPLVPPEEPGTGMPDQPGYASPSAEPPGFPEQRAVEPPAARGVGGGFEADGVSYVPAGLWWRVGAFLIDAVVLFIAHQIMLILVGYAPPDLDQTMVLLERMLADLMASGDLSEATLNQVTELQQLALFTGWLNVFICAAYFTVFHGMMGATLGKLSLGLTVLKHDGSRLGLGVAFVRYMGYFIVAKLAYTAWLIPFNREKRTLYDMLLGTNVYRSEPILQDQFRA